MATINDTPPFSTCYLFRRIRHSYKHSEWWQKQSKEDDNSASKHVLTISKTNIEKKTIRRHGFFQEILGFFPYLQAGYWSWESIPKPHHVAAARLTSHTYFDISRYGLHHWRLILVLFLAPKKTKITWMCKDSRLLLSVLGLYRTSWVLQRWCFFIFFVATWSLWLRQKRDFKRLAF